ncbi:aminopeptidase [Candidatus Bathyarchaeota archaeon]|nr:aminopeptidase [Candidatus Bathyarchaeota archaeon]
MKDERIEKLAKLCVHYSVNVKPKEKVVIRGSAVAKPLISAIYEECLLTGAYPSVFPSLELDYIFFKHAEDHQLKFVSPFERFLAENAEVNISIASDPNPKRLTSIDPSRLKIFRASRRELTEIFYKRVSEGKLRWTLQPFPIEAQAQEASMSLAEYEDFVYKSCLVDRRDPIAEWKKIRKEQQKICSFLDKAEKIRVVGDDTDLTFSVKGRKWINCSGDKNMPDGEVFTGPVENSVNGKIRFTFPGIYMGKEVEDISLTFKRGKVVKASAVKGEDLLRELLKIEGADHIGEAAIGTNYGITRFTKDMLFDEKMGGTIHLALGNGYPDSGSKNKSAIHWDILKNMKNGEIYADGKLFYKNGKFMI